MIRRFILLFVVLLFAPVRLPAQTAETPAREQEEYSVYSALITFLYARSDRRLMVIADPACCGALSLGYSRYPYQESAPVSKEAYEDFRSRNAKHRVLERKFNLPIPYVIAERRELINLVAGPENDFSNFHAKYREAQGFITLARVGFNQSGDEAFVFTCEIFDLAFQPCRFLITTRNAGCEACWFVSLSKKNGIWSVKSMAFHDTPA